MKKIILTDDQLLALGFTISKGHPRDWYVDCSKSINEYETTLFYSIIEDQFYIEQDVDGFDNELAQIWLNIETLEELKVVMRVLLSLN